MCPVLLFIHIFLHSVCMLCDVELTQQNSMGGLKLWCTPSLSFPCSVNVSVKRVGGAYGSKITRSHQITAACALGAFLTKR